MAMALHCKIQCIDRSIMITYFFNDTTKTIHQTTIKWKWDMEGIIHKD